jgi:methanogenic corrinoid protein MtbC1
MAKAGARSSERVEGLFRDGGEGPASGRYSGSLEDILNCLKHETPLEQMGADEQSDLLATIHEQIIPRLVLAHFDDPAAAEACPDSRLPPDAEEVLAFSRIAAAQDLPGALAFVEAMVRDGVSIGTVLLHLVAPAARQLGDDWLADLRNFAEVTLALGTLQEVVHVLGPSFATGIGDRGSVLLVAAPSEQHTLGLHVLGEFIRRAGWTVEVESSLSRGELIDRVESERIEMLGVSVSNEQLVEPLARLVRDVKKASLNADIEVMIGGSLDLADLAAAVGATFCTDPTDAVRHLDAHAKAVGRERHH